MNKVEEIKSAIEKLDLSLSELQQVRDFVDDLIEDGAELSDEFRAKLEQAMATRKIAQQ